jgi:hypothetical protein
MPKAGRRPIKPAAYLVLAGLTLFSGGCLAAVVGVTAGGAAAAGYFYYQGRLYRDFTASMPDGLAATRTALAELQFPPPTEEHDGDRFILITKTTDGSKIDVHLDTKNSPVPVEGSMTRISVRVGHFGDEAVSRRILDQVGWHLVQPGRIVPTPAPPAQIGPIQPTAASRPAETSPPPLAPEPVKTK